MVFAEWNTRAGLSCVSTEHWWLLANLFSLFSSCIKLPIFHFRWGCEAVLRCYFFLLHTHHLWSLGISDKFPDCPKCRLVSTQGDQDPSLGCPCLCGSGTTVIWSTEHWCCGLCVFGEPANVGTSLWTEIHKSLSTHCSLVSISCSGSPLRCAMLLLASCFLELPLSKQLTIGV